MGVTVSTIETVTCDICTSYCEKDDGKIRVEVYVGDRDVEPAIIEGNLKFTQPYAALGGLVCERCKLKLLNRYIKQLAKKLAP